MDEESKIMTSHAVLDPFAHRDLRVRTDFGAELGDNVMAALTVPDEFRHVQGHFPILFRREAGEQDFMALAMLGFQPNENLFLNGKNWEARYRPWSMTVQPFLVGRAEHMAENEAAQVHIDLGHPRIAAEGVEGAPLFDEAGEVSSFLDRIVQILSALDAGFQASGDFFQSLIDYDLLEPLTLNIAMADDSQQSLVGFHIINEERLAELDGDALARLHAAGHLQPIFMAVASLSQISELVNRKNRRLMGA